MPDLPKWFTYAIYGGGVALLLGGVAFLALVILAAYYFASALF